MKPGTIIFSLMTGTLIFSASLIQSQPVAELISADGGVITQAQKELCIPESKRKEILKNIADYKARFGEVEIGQKQTTGPALYPFFPQAGILWQDIHPNNFVDQDDSGGILDFECTGFTYDGHRGTDTGILTWTQKDIGVPIYAALDGVVIDRADGFFDEQTTLNPDNRANYVILDHGGGHQTWYFHFRTNSVAVELNEIVRAGQFLGDTASSGFSTGPHLHFESRLNGESFEPFTGTCNPGESGWVDQISIFRDFYIRGFNVSMEDISGWEGPPVDTPRGAFFESGLQKIWWWVPVNNFPANGSWQVRFKRPDGSIRFDSGTDNRFTNNYFRTGWWRWNYEINFDVTGTWLVELTLANEITVEAPIEVVSSLDEMTNRPPNDIEGLFLTTYPYEGEEVLRCNIESDLLFDDPDYDQIRYRFEWRVNDVLVRDVTIAALSDMIEAGFANPTDKLEVIVTPNDGVQDGNPTTLLRSTTQLVEHQAFIVY